MRKIGFYEFCNGRNGVIILDWYPYRKLRYCHLCCQSAFWNIPNIHRIPNNNQLSKKKCVWLVSVTSKWANSTKTQICSWLPNFLKILLFLHSKLILWIDNNILTHKIRFFQFWGPKKCKNCLIYVMTITESSQFSWKNMELSVFWDLQLYLFGPVCPK